MTQLSITKDVDINMGERTALVTISEKGRWIGHLLLEIVWEKKHWWSLNHPVLRRKRCLE